MRFLDDLLERQDMDDGGFVGLLNLLPPARKGDEPFIFNEITAYSVFLLLRLGLKGTR